MPQKRIFFNEEKRQEIFVFAGSVAAGRFRSGTFAGSVRLPRRLSRGFPAATLQDVRRLPSCLKQFVFVPLSRGGQKGSGPKDLSL